MNDEVKELIEQLKAPHLRIRERAVKALMELGHEAREAVPMIINALEDRSWKVRWESARALGRIGSCIGVEDEPGSEIPGELIKPMFGDSTWNVSLAAINAVAEIGPGCEVVIPGLIELVKEEDEEIRVSSIEALRRIGAAEPEVVKALIEALEDPLESVRRRSAKALVELGASDRKYLQELIKASKDQDTYVRGPAYRLLGRLASEPEVIPLLMKALKEENVIEKWYVVDALAEAGELAVPALTEDLKDPDKETRLIAAHALEGIGAQAREATPVLIKALEDPNLYVRRWVSDTLVKIGIYAAPALIEALNTQDEKLQEQIINVLGKMGKKVVPILIRAIDLGEENQKEKIAKALHEIGPDVILEILHVRDRNP